jgi:anti-sigma B factor antagonist
MVARRDHASDAALSLTMTRLSGDEALLTAVGEIDIATVGQLHSALTTSTAGCDRVILDLTSVAFVSCAALGVLHEVSQRTHVIVVASQRIVLRAFELTGLDKILTVHAAA